MLHDARRELEERYGSWATVWPRDAREMLEGYSGLWWIGGGYALDAAVGRERPHMDLDLVIPRSELSLLRGWLSSEYHIWSAFQGALKPLMPSDSDVLPVGTNQVWLRRSAYHQWEYDVILDPSDSETWRFRKDVSVTRPMSDALVEIDGVRYARPELVLAYLSASPRQADLEFALPALDDAARAWLADRLPAEHPWLEPLRA